MWKSFLTAIGLLAIALAAALYSSNAAHDGRVWGASVGALIALGIALWVGIRFVPRLASRVDWEWLPFFSRYQVTREGWMYFTAVIVVVFAAVNTSNNLLYMVLSALLAVLVLSGFLSAMNFQLIRMSVRIPSHCHAGEPFPLTIHVRNEKRVFPSFSICLEPTEKSPFRFSRFYVPVIRALQSTSQTGQGVLHQRGRYELRELKTSSRYPFGFFLKDRIQPGQGECICYPAILPLERLELGSIDFRGSNPRFHRGSGHDLYMIRDYLPSDSARHVHWKASAKTAILKTREYAAEESNRVTLAFDRYAHPADSDRFEQLVSHAASLAYHMINDGAELQLVSDEWQGTTLESILEYLAVVEMSSVADPPHAEGGAVKLSLRN